MSVIIPIANQPINFIADVQGCKNNDNRAYAMPLQAADILCMQWKHTAETEEPLTDSGALYTNFPVTNGTFTGASTGWTLGAGWTYGSNKVTKAAGSGTAVTQALPTLVTGQIYIITYTVSDYSAGTITVQLGIGGGTVSGAARSANGTYTESITHTDVDHQIGFLADAAFIGSIDTISIIAGSSNGTADWSSPDTDGPFTHVAGNTSILTTLNIGYAAGYYAIGFIISGATAGSVIVTIGDDPTPSASGNGSFMRYGTNVAGDEIFFTPTSDFDGVISEVIYYQFNTDHEARIIDAVTLANVTAAYTNASSPYPLVYIDDRIIWCVMVSASIPLTEFLKGCYKIKITDGTDAEVFISETLISYDEEKPCTVFVVADNDNDYAMDFYWGGVFTMRQRIHALRTGFRYPGESDTYTYSTGRKKRSFSMTEKIWIWWLNWLDEATHDAVNIQIHSDTLTIDGAEYFVVDDNYEPEVDQDGKKNLSRSRIDIQKQGTTLYNRNCG